MVWSLTFVVWQQFVDLYLNTLSGTIPSSLGGALNVSSYDLGKDCIMSRRGGTGPSCTYIIGYVVISQVITFFMAPFQVPLVRSAA